MTGVFCKVEVWSHDADSAVSNELGKSKILALLQSIKLLSVFMAEASTDIVNLLARVMVWSVTGKLKPWPPSMTGAKFPMRFTLYLAISWRQQDRYLVKKMAQQ